MTTDIDALKEFEWERMLGVEIYDLFGTKGLKLGTQANKMLKILKEKKELPEACETTLAKKKADKLLQRQYFENISESGLGILRAGMRFYVNSIVKQLADIGDISANIRARCAHLSVDPDACIVLDIIFSGRPKEEQREYVVVRYLVTEPNIQVTPPSQYTQGNGKFNYRMNT